MTYRLDSDLQWRYGCVIPRNKSTTINMSSRWCIDGRTAPYRPLSPPEAAEVAVPKDRLVAWAVSNCETQSGREEYVEELRRHLSVDVYGRCGELSCSTTDCRETLGRYKFYLAFENSLCTDYVTEKLFGSIARGLAMVPVVMGGADYARVLPPGSYIDSRDFDSPK